jgi:hypothetical protein
MSVFPQAETAGSELARQKAIGLAMNHETDAVDRLHPRAIATVRVGIASRTACFAVSSSSIH